MAEAAMILTILSSVLYFASRRLRRLHTVATVSLGLASVALLALIVYRSVRIGFPALTGTYEGLLLLAAGLAAFLVVAEGRLFRENPDVMAGGALAAFVYLAVLNSPLISSALHPPVPILRSAWLVLHVAFAFFGLALFTVGCIAAIVGFLQADPASADRARDRSIALGFAFYAVGGLVFGAIWAEAAWGRFWGWDPKETWALITTLLYAGYLHLRFLGRVKPSVSRILAIIAWIAALFTFFGVNYLLPGLHSYA